MKLPEIQPQQQQVLNKALIGPSPQTGTATLDHKSRLPADKSKAAAVNLQTDAVSHAIRIFESLNTIMSEVATSIRNVDESMKNIGNRIKKMKSTLTEILKQYPPFPPGSEERVAILKGFSALRRQIDALSFPPDDSGAQRIMSDLGDTANRPSRVNLGDDEVNITIQRLPVHAGPEGLGIPDLPSDAGDDQVEQMLGILDQASEILGRRQASLAEEAKHIFQLQ